jgi:hypothetical protein
MYAICSASTSSRLDYTITLPSDRSSVSITFGRHCCSVSSDFVMSVTIKHNPCAECGLAVCMLHSLMRSAELSLWCARYLAMVLPLTTGSR